MKWVRDNIDGPPFKEWYETLSKSQKKIRTVFWNLNHNKNLFFLIVNRWNKCDLDQINITSEDLLQSVVCMYKITNHPKTRSFHYRLINRAIITNILLAHYKIKSFDLCMFCNVEPESLNHLFLTCKCVKLFWCDVIKWINLDKDCLTFKNIILNTF